MSLSVAIVPDTDPESPREFTNLGQMICRHPRYDLGDHHPTVTSDELGEWVEEADGWAGAVERLKKETGATVVLPLFLYDHSAVVMSVGSADQIGDRYARGHFPADGYGWDSSFVGLIHDSVASRKECGTPVHLIEQALRGEVRVYSQYLTGDVWGYRIDSPDGHTVEACWGFYGQGEAEQAAREAVALAA